MKAEEIKKEAVIFCQILLDQKIEKLFTPTYNSAKIEQALEYLHERKKVEDEVFRTYGK